MKELCHCGEAADSFCGTFSSLLAPALSLVFLLLLSLLMDHWLGVNTEPRNSQSIGGAVLNIEWVILNERAISIRISVTLSNSVTHHFLSMVCFQLLSSPSVAFLSLPTHCHDFLLGFFIGCMLAVKSLLLDLESKASKHHQITPLKGFCGFPDTWCGLNST